MNSTRTGKIARLPKYLRDQLGQRLENGEPGKELVKWLNGVPEVQEVLKEQFDGRPISEQNLSEWKQGGHAEWLRQEEIRLLAGRLTEQSDALEEAADEKGIGDRFASILAVELVRLATAMLEEETDPEKRWRRLCQIHQELSQLRQDDHEAVRTQIKRQRWSRQVQGEEEASDKRFEQEERERRVAPFFARLRLGSMAEMFGGGDHGRDIAAFILEIQNDLPMGRLGRAVTDQPKPGPAGPGPTESGSIKPDQG